MSDLYIIKEIESIIRKPLLLCPVTQDIMAYNENHYYRTNSYGQLTGLNLAKCNLIDINFLKELKYLTKISLKDNEISDIHALKELKNLTSLSLRNNQLNDISALKELKNLTNLSLGNNQLNDISALKELKNLTKLSLENNRLSNINVLKKTKNLNNLDLRHNFLKELPEWVLGFDLKVDVEWDRNYGDGVFLLKDNPLEKPPPEIIQQGNKAIRSYFYQLKEKGTDYIYEAKLIIVGEGSAGKTSLAKKVINPKYQLLPENESESTQGVDIFLYEFPYKDKNFRVNIWDFGGQEIYHQTHQFFLSKRSLYFLVADSRKEDTDFYYWLNAVDLLTNHSPLLIIKNEKNNRSRQIPEKQLKAEFNNIKEILTTNLNGNRGLDSIINNLQHHITQLPHIGSPLPKTWVKIRQQLEQDSRYHIDLREYYTLCHDNGLEREADKLQLSEYLHDLGICLHFQDDDVLKKTLVLKPTWATDAVYKVLDNCQVIANFGRFNKDNLIDIWQDKKYISMQGELLALMLNFKLCFEIPNKLKHYIAPQLLENDPPYYQWQDEGNLLLRYQYDFMPKGLVSQFIVVMHEYIGHNYQWVWKNGVVLTKDYTQAEIIEDYGKREIRIRISGQHKQELLAIVSYRLDEINNSYERLKDKCKKLIPCNCLICSKSQHPHFYNNEIIRAFKRDKQENIQCQISYQMVSIIALIDDSELTFNKNNGQTEENNMNKSGDTIIATNYIKEMNNGNVAGRNIITQNIQGITKEEFVELLQIFKQDLLLSNIQNDDIEVITNDIESIEKQLQKDEPKKSLIKRKLEGINGILDDANNTMNTIEKGDKMLDKLLLLGKNLGIAFSFFT